jgi:hypothetical protein
MPNPFFSPPTLPITIKRHNTQILTTANSGILTANNLTGTLSANMFYNLANRIEDNEVDVHEGFAVVNI